MLCLPRDSSTLSVVRHITASALEELGVVPEEVGDVILALTEAAANVVKHSGADDQYEVHLVIENATCEIRVIDSGRGFDSDSLGVNMAGPSEERGRGMALMAALVDSVRFESRPEAGTIVHLVKDLSLRPDGPLRRLVQPTATA
ncbi:MAG TPA: ATP-binding protein [Acidimicrobiales bacterium]|jgi:serine/threonine-protein kinase RsbW|nr:ATP-binding protein [Acidimicrobiales bacterium]HWI02774.1 ATP-binding protein [Acidimicrobiales bacterium]